MKQKVCTTHELPEKEAGDTAGSTEMENYCGAPIEIVVGFDLVLFEKWLVGQQMLLLKGSVTMWLANKQPGASLMSCSGKKHESGTLKGQKKTETAAARRLSG